MAETTAQDTLQLLLGAFEKHWVCRVQRSGFHNGARCDPDEPHGEWGCGWRREATLTEESFRAFAERAASEVTP